MPNWCENDLIIQGSQIDIDNFLSDFKMTRNDTEVFFDFNLIDPYPVFSEKEGRDWLLKNWGTKSNGEDCVLEVRSTTEVVLHFSTAWSPPTPLMDKLSLQYPNLTFILEYFEAGMGFSGTKMYKKGWCIHESSNDNYTGPRGG